MSKNVNKVILVGRLGKDPETNDAGRTTVTKFSVATTEYFKGKEKNADWEERTEWHNVVIWGANGEKADEVLRKGDLVYIEGKLKTDSWEDKSGNKRYSTNVVASTWIAMGDSNEKGSGRGRAGRSDSRSKRRDEEESDYTRDEITDDDIPF